MGPLGWNPDGSFSWEGPNRAPAQERGNLTPRAKSQGPLKHGSQRDTGAGGRGALANGAQDSTSFWCEIGNVLALCYASGSVSTICSEGARCCATAMTRWTCLAWS